MATKRTLHLTDNPARRLAMLRRVMKSTLGEKKNARLWKQIEPVVRDAAGHGDATPDKQLVGDAEVPGENFWEGVWQIYVAD